jgi:hypothetical protein
VELFVTVGETLSCDIHKPNDSLWNREELPQNERNLLFCKTEYSNYLETLLTDHIETFIQFSLKMKLLRIISVDFEARSDVLHLYTKGCTSY